MIYERMAEKVVSILIPFYNEFKSLVLLFLIFTRARVCGFPLHSIFFFMLCRRVLSLFTSISSALS
jgi:hypothetical protein